MASRIECPRCGELSANFVQSVCRACYMRDYHQRRSAAAAKDIEKAVETPTLVDGSEGQRLCIECKAPGTYARGLCLYCCTRERQRRHRQGFCVECGATGTYARGLCQNWLMMRCCDPPAISLTAAVPGRNPQSEVGLLKIMDDVVQVAE